MKNALNLLVEPIRNLSATAFIRTKRITSTACVTKSRVVFKYLHICVSCVAPEPSVNALASSPNFVNDNFIKMVCNCSNVSVPTIVKVDNDTSSSSSEGSDRNFNENPFEFSVCNNDRYLIPLRYSRKMNHTEDSSVNSELNPLLSSKSETLTFFQRISYGFGHVFNDLCAAMWFSYLLFYLQIILQMESATAGVLLMIGQVSDALATPVAGWAVDKFGTRTLWHLTGTIMVAISFPLVFTTCNICAEDSETQRLFYHVVVIVIFQIGWAVVQISHLSMIPNLTSSSGKRSELTAIRYTAAVCSSVVAYMVTWIILRSNNSDSVIGPQDYFKFKEIIVVIIIIGAMTSVVFYSGIKWQHYYLKGSMHKESTINLPIRKILLSPLIYQISLLYVASRLYMTLNLVYMPLYLDERVTANISVSSENLRESLASVPLVSFIASFITSLVLKNRTEHWGNKVTYFIGSVISFSSCLCIGLYIAQTTNVFYVYAVAVLIGTGSSVTIIASLCLTAEIIGPNINRGASVYSIVTFTDKLICGVAVVIIEHLKCSNKAECPEYYRYVLAYVSGGAALFGLITLGSLLLPQRPVATCETRNL